LAKNLDTLARELGKLAEYLSEDHDLAVLKERAITHSEALVDSSEIYKLIVLLNHRRIQLQYKATSLGSRLFAEKPKAFVSRLEAYWYAWRPNEAPEPAGIGQLTLAAYAASQH
jgi:hypothetical protein